MTIKLHAERPEPDGAVVHQLEQMLERARSGEVRQVCIAGRMTGGEIATVIAGENMAFTMLGGLRYLEHRLVGTIEDE